MADAFGSFWYFGAIKFFLVAVLLRRYYRSAMLGSVPAQLFYMLLLTPGMLSITHYTQSILSAWVHLAIFLIPVLMWARKPVLPKSVLAGKILKTRSPFPLSVR
jgi:hypothetical protein